MPFAVPHIFSPGGRRLIATPNAGSERRRSRPPRMSKKETSCPYGLAGHDGVATQPSAEEEVSISTITLGVDLAKSVLRCARWRRQGMCCGGLSSSATPLSYGWFGSRQARWWRRRPMHQQHHAANAAWLPGSVPSSARSGGQRFRPTRREPDQPDGRPDGVPDDPRVPDSPMTKEVFGCGLCTGPSRHHRPNKTGYGNAA